MLSGTRLGERKKWNQCKSCHFLVRDHFDCCSQLSCHSLFPLIVADLVLNRQQAMVLVKIDTEKKVFVCNQDLVHVKYQSEQEMGQFPRSDQEREGELDRSDTLIATIHIFHGEVFTL